MEKQLGNYLFNGNIRLYAVLDGASIPDLPARLYDLRPPHVCLYRGELEPDLAEVAPYLVNLVPGADFTNWLLDNCWGKHWGIFAQTQFSLVEVRKHFRRFLTVHDESGNPMLFRYYDPRVLNKFLPVCKADELAQIFERVVTFFAESDDAKELLSFKFENNALVQTNFSEPPAQPQFQQNIYGDFRQPIYQPTATTGFNNYA